MDYTLKEYIHFKKSDFKNYVLGGDIGGTNTNLGVAGIRRGKPILLFSMHFKSKKLKSLIPAVNTILDHAFDTYGIRITRSCMGAAGPVSPDHDFVKLTNLSWSIKSSELIKKTKLKNVLIVNDFALIGFAVNVLDVHTSQDLFKVRHLNHPHKEVKHGTRLVLGAGTGLGVSLLGYDKQNNSFLPLASEGGHSDLPLIDPVDQSVAKFICKKKKLNRVSYEDVLSGKGIQLLYEYVRSTKKYKSSTYTREIDRHTHKTPLIGKYYDQDATCKSALQLFLKYYARCAKNLAIISLARGGIYIGGGIAARYKDIFKEKIFMQEFESNKKFKSVLKQIPIYVIVNYDVSLHGACFAAQ